jgi:Uncharacterized protein conserved in bacteria C-term(DUF2220)
LTAADRFYRSIVASAGERARVELEVLWQAFQAAHPEQAVSTGARSILRDLLDQVFIAGLAEPPKGGGGWDQSAKPILPKWIRLPRSRCEKSKVDLLRIPWAPELRFLPAIHTSVPLGDLLKLQRFFAENGRALPVVPIKERSLQIFADEKRLDELYSSSNLFNPGRLTLEQLRSFAIAEPLGWKRGPLATTPLIVIENVATWHSYCQWNEEVAQFSAVVYGGGNRFIDSVRTIGDIYREVGGMRRILYFGDLDANGLNIPQRASEAAKMVGLPAVEAHLDSYRWLIELGDSAVTKADSDVVLEKSACDWLKEMADRAWTIISAGKRIAQERIGWQLLQTRSVARES